MTAIMPKLDYDNGLPWESHPNDYPSIKTKLSKPSQVASLIRQQIKRGMPDAPQGCSVVSAGVYTRAESNGRDNYLEYTKTRGQLSGTAYIRLDVHDKLDRGQTLKLFRMVCRVLHINNIRHSWSQNIGESIKVWTSYENTKHDSWMTGSNGMFVHRNVQFDSKTQEYVEDENGNQVYVEGERQLKPLFAYSEDL